MEQILQHLGLTGIEARIYYAIVELGSVMAGDISIKTGIHRRSVYDAVQRLIEKGMISYIKMNNRKYFQAVHPKKLAEIMEEKNR